jgi:hypothetical protein
MRDDIIMAICELDRSGRYDAYVDGRYIVSSSQPFLDGARCLIEQGYDPSRRLVVRREDREHYDMTGPLGVAAGLTVKSDRCGKPKFVRWTGEESKAAASPVRQKRMQAGKPTPAPKNASRVEMSPTRREAA